MQIDKWKKPGFSRDGENHLHVRTASESRAVTGYRCCLVMSESNVWIQIADGDIDAVKVLIKLGTAPSHVTRPI
jgi:hypothetical protein